MPPLIDPTTRDRPEGWPPDAPAPLKAVQAIPIAGGLGVALHVRCELGEFVLPMTNALAFDVCSRAAVMADNGRWPKGPRQ